MSQLAAEPDLAALGPWLAEHGEVAETPLVAARIGLGQSNLTYLATDASGGRWVLRRPPLGHLLESAHDVAREHRILAGLAGTPVPIPPVVGLWQADGVPHLVTRYVDGLVLDREERAGELAPAAVAALGGELARTLAGIHAVDLAAAGLADLASHGPYADRQLRRWSRQLDASRTRESPELDRLTELLRAHVPQQHEVVLVHGDLHLSNVIADPRTGQVRAALDWELSTLGAPLADLGTTLAYWPEPGEDGTVLLPRIVAPGLAHRADLVRAYAEVSGRDVADVGFWHVLGLWKVAVIVEGIRRRVLDEPRNAASGGPPPAQVVDHLVAQAWQHAAAYGW